MTYVSRTTLNTIAACFVLMLVIIFLTVLRAPEEAKLIIPVWLAASLIMILISGGWKDIKRVIRRRKRKR